MKSLPFSSTQAMISTAASVAATAMLLRSMLRDYLPTELHNYLHFKLGKFITSFSTQLTLVIEEYQGFSSNLLFGAALLYLRPHMDPKSKRFRVSMPHKYNNISVIMDTNQQITDHFNGVQFTWKYVSKHTPSRKHHQRSYLELRFHKRHRGMVLEEYLAHVMEKAKELKEEQKTLKLFTLKKERVRVIGRRVEMWESVNLDHPATFETLAMDLEAKRSIMDDLDRFVERRDMYRRVGKAWKRGYLLFGPPGTGKSSLIAAMANYLNFDVYDLDLTHLTRNSDLRKLLISTQNRSILVVEDIDCSLQLHDRHTKPPIIYPYYPFHNPQPKPQVTLSGFLNFIDGLWSSCGDERIIVFTTNKKEKLDPALLRPGRMDVHIHMSYCTPCGFRMLASNYLGITHHPLFVEIDKLIEFTNVTPAEVGEQLLKNDDSEIALTSLIQFLLEKKKMRALDERKNFDGCK